MIPVIALVGRPNVGKSTLFNRLTASRDALVADEPGLTRDRKYGQGSRDERKFIVIDTGGLTGERAGVDPLIEKQVAQAIEEADIVWFLVDGKTGPTADDEELAQRLRRQAKNLWLVVNKTESVNKEIAMSEFAALGLSNMIAVSATHGEGVWSGVDALLELFPEDEESSENVQEYSEAIKVAVVGRPNVGKSTLVNRFLGEDRLVTFDMPGTTRDSVFVPFERRGKQFVLIDTAGIRRRARVHETVEKFSVIKALQSIDAANVVIMIIDAVEGVTDQDTHLLGYILEAGRSLIIAINKWDKLDAEIRQKTRDSLDRKLQFVDFAKQTTISALHGSGTGHLLDEAERLYHVARRALSTPMVTQVLQDAVAEHPPPLVRGRRIKLRYAHQGGINPPVIVIHGNQTEALPGHYKRYLMNVFRQAFQFEGTPVRLEFRTGDNPYKGRRNKLTPRQQRRRKRLIKHVRKK